MPIKRRDLVRKVCRFGGWEDAARGKGGDRLLMRKDPANERAVLRYPLGFHGDNRDVVDSVVRAVRRRLRMTPLDGVSDEAWRDA